MAQVGIWTLTGVVLLASCSAGPSAEEVTSEQERLALSSRTVVARITLPSTLTAAALLVAQDHVLIGNGVTVNGPIWSAGTVEMQDHVTAQSLTCTGNVELDDHDSVTEVTLGGLLTKGHGDVIGKTTYASLRNVTSSISVTFPAPTSRVTVSSGESKIVGPGSYVAVEAAAGATLTLLAGDYYVSRLILEHGSVLRLSPVQGATRLFVASGMMYQPMLAHDADASRFFVEYLGTEPVLLKKAFRGSLVAPRASLTIGNAEGGRHRGSFMARSIRVHPHAKLEFVSFNPAGTMSACENETWDPDGNPFTPCVTKTVCEPGSYVSGDGSPTSDRTCTGCPSGQFSTISNAPGCADWSTCLAGTYLAVSPSATADRICLPCPDGQYSNGSNQSQCLSQGSCLAGSVQTAAGTPTSPVVCVMCAAGEFCPGGSGPRLDCPTGTWDNDRDPATDCVSKTMCLAGNQVADEGTTTTDRDCAACTSGTFSAVSNATTCTSWSTCLPGTFVANVPSSTADRICSICPGGQYSTGINQASCQDQGSCPAGTVQTASGTIISPTVCTGCEPGSYCAGGATPSVACAAGTWDDDGSAATPCVAKTTCVPGKFVVSEGTMLADRVCAACPSGNYSTMSNVAACTAWTNCSPGYYFSNTPSATENRACTVCPTGQYSTTINTSACIPRTDCPPGTYVSNYSQSPPTTDSVCTPCPSGQYSSGTNQPSCLNQACAAGSVQTAPGTPTSPAQCAACVAGQYCAGGTSNSITCPSETWDHDANPATVCKPMRTCPPGTFSTVEGTPTKNRVCNQCPPGYVFNFQWVLLPAQAEVSYSMVADFNHDGIPDLFSCGASSRVWLGLGDGRFGAPVIGNPDTSGKCAVGDYNHDGNLDVLVVKSAISTNCTVSSINCDTWTTISVFPGLGDGRLGPPVTSEVPGVTSPFCGTVPSNAVVADVNLDGTLDLITANAQGNLPSTVTGQTVFLGQPDGTFAHSTTTCLSLSLIDGGPFAEVGDFNGDNIPDFVVTSTRRSVMVSAMGRVFIGSGNGAFTLEQFSAIFASPGAGYTAPPLVVDIDQDGKDDITVFATYTGNLVIRLSEGGVQSQLTLGSAIAALAAGDLNRDGYPDLVAASAGLAILWGGAGRAFSNRTNVAMAGTPSLVKVVDVNGDGLPDIVTDVGGVSVLLNQGGCQP